MPSRVSPMQLDRFLDIAGANFSMPISALSEYAVVGTSVTNDVVEIMSKPLGPPLKMPRLGLGTFQMTDAECEEAVSCALQEGYRLIDTAQLFRNEAAVGRAIRNSGLPREEIFVTTKLWNSSHGYQKCLQTFDQSLKTLGLDYVDLYLVHSPMQAKLRLDTWRAMESILSTGKAKAIGVSNYGIHHLEELLQVCKVKPAVNQIEAHPFHTQCDLAHYCTRKGIVVQAYSPLTKGRRVKEPKLIEIAARYKKTVEQLLIRWSLQKGYALTMKSSKPAHIASNAQVYNFEISSADMLALDNCNQDFITGWDPTLCP